MAFTPQQIALARKLQIENSLRHAREFIDDPRGTAIRFAPNASGMIGGVANSYGDAPLKAIADEIDGIADAIESGKTSPVQLPSDDALTRHLRQMVDAYQAGATGD